VRLFQGLADVPIFNPDIENAEPAPVARLREQVSAADALIIASPEYAHGITGVLKNALDWLVSSEAFIHKPVALFNASPRSVHAAASLREVVGVMSARVVDAACIVVPPGGSRLDEWGIVADPAMSATIRQALADLSSAVAEFRRRGAL
jgi:NAD(P)H-dependent FMN reductase